MELHKVIVGSIVTEKSEQLKAARSYTLKIATDANKVEVKNALKKHFDVDAASVRVMRVVSKTRSVGPYRTFTKRQTYKKAVVTLAPKSKALDLSKFTI